VAFARHAWRKCTGRGLRAGSRVRDLRSAESSQLGAHERCRQHHRRDLNPQPAEPVSVGVIRTHQALDLRKCSHRLALFLNVFRLQVHPICTR
jgi:hypothetical protein